MHSPAQSSAPSAPPWWRDAVVYQIYPRSFADSNGDGTGDLDGVRSRLPYLAALGVDAVWLTPFYPSPQADGGYDVADYRDVDPMYGDLAAAEALLHEAHAHGLRVIVDIVPNHTSHRHPWFQAALAERGSAERDRYLFRPGRGDGPPNDWLSLFGGPAWTCTDDGEWYLHLYTPEQPDLNWGNPEVHTEFESVLRFWLDRGVDDFRIDVAHGLFKDLALPDLGERRHRMMVAAERRDHPCFDREEVHEVYRRWRQVTDAYDGDRTLVAEARVATPERRARYLRRDELHTGFDFDFLEAPWDAAPLRAVIDKSVTALTAVGAPPIWALSNHDKVRHVTRYADGDPARGTRRARAAALLMLALPGGAYIYQGEELGLPEVTDLPDEALQDPIWARSGHTNRGRDGCRVPLPWTRDGASYGFGPGGSWLPQPGGWGGYAVDAQEGEPGSMLRLYRDALRIRRAEPALGDGAMSWQPSAPEVLAFTRPGAAPAAPVTCVLNLGEEPVPLPDGHLLLSSSPDQAATDSRTVPPDSAVWVRG